MRLRGCRSVDPRGDDEAFVDTILQPMNACATTPLTIRRSEFKSLQVRRTAEFAERSARVSKCAIFTAHGAQYRRSSQLIGHRLMVRLCAKYLECWLGGRCVLSRPCARVGDGQRHGRVIAATSAVGDHLISSEASAGATAVLSGSQPSGVPKYTGTCSVRKRVPIPLRQKLQPNHGCAGNAMAVNSPKYECAGSHV